MGIMDLGKGRERKRKETSYDRSLFWSLLQCNIAK